MLQREGHKSWRLCWGTRRSNGKCIALRSIGCGRGQRDLSAGPGILSFAISPGSTAIASVGARLRNTASVPVLNGSHCCLRLQEAWESDCVDRAELVGMQRKRVPPEMACREGSVGGIPNNNPPEIIIASIAGEDSRVGKVKQFVQGHVANPWSQGSETRRGPASITR